MSKKETNDISTNRFLSELNKEVNKHEDIKAAAFYFGISGSFLRSVLKGSELPGYTILKKMKFKSVKNVKYRYEKL